MSCRVGLLWHSFSSANLGVGALSLCNLKLIDQQLQKVADEIEYVVIGNVGHLQYAPHGDYRISSVEFNLRAVLRHPLRIVRQIASCDIIFDIGEGDSFSDIYGLPRFFKFLSGKLLANLFSVPLLMSPQTIGPFRSPSVKALARWAMGRCVQVFARDDQSGNVLDEMGLSNTQVSIDVAFALDYIPGVAEDPNPLRVGLNVSGLLYNGGYSRDNQFGLALDYKDFTHKLIEHLLARENIELHLVPHVLAEKVSVESDTMVCEQLKQDFPDVLMGGPFTGPEEAKSYIAGLDCFLGARMHSTIAAISSGVPVIPLAYSMKFAGLYSSIGYPHVIDMKLQTAEQVLAMVADLLERLPELEGDLSNALVRANDRLEEYSAVLERVIQEHISA